MKIPDKYSKFIVGMLLSLMAPTLFVASAFVCFRPHGRQQRIPVSALTETGKTNIGNTSKIRISP